MARPAARAETRTPPPRKTDAPSTLRGGRRSPCGGRALYTVRTVRRGQRESPSRPSRNECGVIVAHVNMPGGLDRKGATASVPASELPAAPQDGEGLRRSPDLGPGASPAAVGLSGPTASAG